MRYLTEDMTWANDNPTDLSKMLKDALGMKQAVIKKMVARRDWTLTPMTPAITKEEQTIADVFFNDGVLNKQINVADNVITVQP